MVDYLYRSTANRPRWDTAGANVPPSRDTTTHAVDQQCGVHTANGVCRSMCQHSSVFCPTHARLANKYTHKYHACTNMLVHSDTTKSAQEMLRYIVALRTVVYIMYKDAYDHKSLDDAAAATHMMPINYFERLVRERADMPVKQFVYQVTNPPGIVGMVAAMPSSMAHLLDEPRMYEDLLNDTTAEDIVPEAASMPTTTTADSGDTADSATSTASSSSESRPPPRRARRVMADVSLHPYEETGTQVVAPIEMWVEFARRVDHGNNVQLVLSFPYANRNLEGTMRLTGTVITYLYDAQSGKYIFGSDTFYGRNAIKAEDYQVMRIMSSFDASTTAKVTSAVELRSATTEAIVFNSQNCFLIEFTALSTHDHRAMRAYVIETLLVLSQRYKHAIRALLDIETIESRTMTRRNACRFPLLSKRFLSKTDTAIKDIFEKDLMQAVKAMTKHKKQKMGQINITDPHSLVQECMRQEIFIETLKCRIKYIVSETPASASVPQMLRLSGNWWKTQPISTLTLADKFSEQTRLFADNLTALQASAADETTAMFTRQMGPHKMDFLQKVQAQIQTEMAEYKEPSRPVLTASDIEELNRKTQALIVN